MISDNVLNYFKLWLLWKLFFSIFLNFVAFFSCLLACTAIFMFYRKWCDAPLRLCVTIVFKEEEEELISLNNQIHYYIKHCFSMIFSLKQ